MQKKIILKLELILIKKKAKNPFYLNYLGSEDMLSNELAYISIVDNNTR